MVEMWERFAFYGMKSLLVLFLVAPDSKGGLGLPDANAAAIFGLYAAGASLMNIVGGWAADRGLGSCRSIEIGGYLNIGGYLLMTIGALMQEPSLVFAGLALDASGTGFLKPNASAVVGRLFPEGGARRDAGFSFFYMGINIGAVLGSMIVPILAAKIGWWAGFSAAAVGMSLGLVQWYWVRSSLTFEDPTARRREAGGMKPWLASAGWVAISSLAIGLFVMALHRDPVALAALSSKVMVLIGIIGFTYILTRPELTSEQRKRLWGIWGIGLCMCFFLIGYQQGGTSINLFIQRFTDRTVFGTEIPAGTFLSLLPVFIIVMAPVIGALWLALSRRGIELPALAKMGIGIMLLGAAFAVMSAAAETAQANGIAGVWWIVLTLFLISVADLLVYPVVLSAIAALSPPSRAGMVMGLTAVFGAMGNMLSSLVAARMVLTDPGAMSEGFGRLSWQGVALGATVVVVVLIGLRVWRSLQRTSATGVASDSSHRA
jgi:POT family proton-dependent oligopeptide transporter